MIRVRVSAASIALLIVVMTLTVASCGDDTAPAVDVDPRPTPIDGNVTVPAAWRGEWNTIVEFRDCNSGDLVAVEDVVDVICGGDTLHLDISPILDSCDGLLDNDRLDVACGHLFVVGTCEVTVSFLLNLDVDGDMITGSGVWTAETVGACSVDYPAGCEQIELTATRLEVNPEPCEAPSFGSLDRLRSISSSRGAQR